MSKCYLNKNMFLSKNQLVNSIRGKNQDYKKCYFTCI